MSQDDPDREECAGCGEDVQSCICGLSDDEIDDEDDIQEDEDVEDG